MTHIAGDHRSGEDFPYLSSHGSVEREWNLLLKETFLAWRSIFHWTMIGGSIIFFNVEHHRHPNVQLVFLGWKPPQIPEAIYKHPEVLKRGSSKINGFDSLISVSFLWPTKKGLWSWKWCAAPGGSRPHGRCLRRKSFKWFRFDAKKAAFWNFDVLHDVHIDLIYVHSNVSESNAWLMYLWRVVWKRLFLKRSEALRPEWL